MSYCDKDITKLQYIHGMHSEALEIANSVTPTESDHFLWEMAYVSAEFLDQEYGNGNTMVYAAKGEFYMEQLERHAHKAWKGYVAIGEYEHESVNSSRFQALLYHGLKKMVRLQSVNFDSQLWHRHLDEARSVNPVTLEADFSGSPVARSWHPLHLRPKQGHQVMELFYKQMLDVTLAVANSLRTIRRFDNHPFSFHGGWPSCWLRRLETENWGPVLHAVYRTLDRFDLRVEMDREEAYEMQDALGILPALIPKRHA